MDSPQSQDDLDAVFLRQCGQRKFGHKIEVEVVVLTMKNSVFEVLSQRLLGDSSLDGLDSKPFSGALGNLCWLLVCTAQVQDHQPPGLTRLVVARDFRESHTKAGHTSGVFAPNLGMFLACKISDDPRDGRRVDPPGKVDANRHIGTQAETDRVDKPLTNASYHFVHGAYLRFCLRKESEL
jgi:hypothetical protein